MNLVEGLAKARLVVPLLLFSLAAPVSAQAPYGTPPAATTSADTVKPPTVVSGAGDITLVVAAYRTLLGDPNNGGVPGSQPAGRREINWDGVPDQFAAPNFLPGDFFNAATDPRARGALLATPGTGLQVSANSSNPTGTPVRFGNINPSYPALFQTFSPERLFSPIGSNEVNLTFAVPGSQSPAQVRGFGAVYTNVETDHTAFEYFDNGGNSLGRFTVPVASGGLSFLGVAFDQPVVARVSIVYGSVALGPDDGPDTNVAVMDDFIYGEPQTIPY
ncbi:MAG: hypothetical protein JOZ65_17070 [Chloroflexi bacterium]|nr:hypothetical protein [Chloroflexota bacterium]